jgi:peptidoglycan/xylan/chitin deacetylase (PgdA/CDA1 family)
MRLAITAVMLVIAVGVIVIVAVRWPSPARTVPSTAVVAEAPSTSSTTTAAPSTTTDPTTTATVTTASSTSTTTSLPAHIPLSAQPLHVPILVYHYVDAAPPFDGPIADDLTVRTHEFEAQMAYLTENGYSTVTLEQIYRAMAGETQLPPRPVALTFDDGGLDNYTVAFPELEARGFVATFFVITGAVGEQGHMTWDQLRDMQQNGMGIGSHTVKHPDLREVDDARLQTELADSRAAILRELGVAPPALCYPGGKYDTRIVEAAYNAGYLLAVTTRVGSELRPEDVYQWPRVTVGPRESIGEFAASLE